eukprot:COSAG01_NODE_4851_length_4683_cov_2.011778_7_plen_215_part_00
MEVGNCSCAVRMNYYPPLRRDEVARSPGDEGGGRGGSNGGVVQGRLLGHEDVTMFTLLPAPCGEGLEVLNRRNMRWVKLAAPPGSIILNTGDYMQRISADRFARRFHSWRSSLAEIYLCCTCSCHEILRRHPSCGLQAAIHHTPRRAARCSSAWERRPSGFAAAHHVPTQRVPVGGRGVGGAAAPASAWRGGALRTAAHGAGVPHDHHHEVLHG